MDMRLSQKNGYFDLNIKDGDLESDEGMETAIAISLFTDRRVNEEDLPPGHSDKRGWWGDMFSEVDQDKIGSRLWTIFPGKTTQETLRKSEDYSTEALQWMIDDGIVDAINVSSSYNESKHLNSQLSVTRPDGRTSRWDVLWDKQEIRRS